MTYKLDIWNDIMPAIDRRDMKRYSKLTTEERKGFSFPIVMRTASSVQGDPNVRDWYLLSINERVNKHGALLSRHPELQYRLMASCGVGSRQNHPWIAMPKKAAVHDILYDLIRENWEGANDLECKIILKQIDDEKFLSLIREMGLDPDRSKEVTEAYERYTGKRSRAKSKAKPKAKSKR